MERNNKPYSVEMNNVISNKMQDAYSQYNFSSAVQQLQNFENFRSFADAVVVYMKKHFVGEIPETREFSCFEKMRKEAGVPEVCSDRTWRNWKKDSWPSDRETAFRIAFALSLTTEETEEFFQKAFFDRPFDAKSILDVVCYYCIGRNLPWAKVEELKTIIGRTEVDPDQKLGPRQCRILSSIQQDIDNYYIGTGEKKLIRSPQASTRLEISTKEKLLKEATEEELISHCVKLKVFDSGNHNMRLKVCAKKWLGKAKEKCKVNVEMSKLNKYMQLLTKGLESDIEQGHARNNSNSSLLNNVLGIKLYSYKDDVNTTKTSLQFMKKKIINQLPSPEILDQIEGETCNNTLFLRNTIILMSFYCFCVDNDDDILKRINDDILKKINNELILSGTYPLYVGFPFDWMFVFSLYSNNLSPLDCFQALFDSAYEVEKIIKLNINEQKSTHVEKSVYDDLTNEQKELFVLARGGDKAAKKELAQSFLLANEMQNPSLFDKVFWKFQSVYKTRYQSVTIQAPFDENHRSKSTQNSASFLRYNDSDFEKIFVSACMKAIDSFEEDYQASKENRPQAKLTSWIFEKSYIVFQHPSEYELYISQPSYSEMWDDIAAETMSEKYVDKMDDRSKWIMEYRLGLTGPICSKFINLRDKMKEDHSMKIDRDDVIAAERKFIRLLTLSNAERSAIKK